MKVRNRKNMPHDAVLALVHMVNVRGEDLRNHSKVDVEMGITVRNQTWREIAEALNESYGCNLTAEQCTKKFLNIKQMVRSKLEDQERRRQQPGLEQYTARLTEAEQEYLRVFFGHNTSFVIPPRERRSKAEGIKVEMDEEDEEVDEEPGEDEGEVPDEEEGDDAYSAFRIETGSSLTDAILGIIPPSLVQHMASNSANNAEASHVPSSSSTFSAPTPMQMQRQNSAELQHGSVQQIANQSGGQQLNLSEFVGRKRRLEPPMEANTAKGNLTNGFGHEPDEREAIELRHKRLKCELLEKRILELERKEEWRMKQEFLLGRQTTAMENIVIQLRAIKEKLK